MYTEEYILAQHTDIDMEKIEVPDFSKGELSMIEEYVEYTRHMQEINQLFRVARSNLRDMLLHYQLNEDDMIIRRIDFEEEEDDRIIINALTINYISSVKTFVESIEVFIKERLGEKELNDFKANCLSKIYDKKFSYRLLNHLRNYSQHGHLPVYMSKDGRCSFDLDQIINTPHFTHNESLKNEMIDYSKQIYEKFLDNPRIVFTRSIAELELCVLEIYDSFLDFVRGRLEQLDNECNKLIEERPDIIYQSEDSLNGYIVYFIDEETGMAHCINPKDKPLKELDNTKALANQEWKRQKEEFENKFHYLGEPVG